MSQATLGIELFTFTFGNICTFLHFTSELNIKCKHLNHSSFYRNFYIKWIFVNCRKGLKAAFMLIPLFGLQLILTIYRPEPTATWIKEYEYATFIITNSQVQYFVFTESCLPSALFSASSYNTSQVRLV